MNAARCCRQLNKRLLSQWPHFNLLWACLLVWLWGVHRVDDRLSEFAMNYGTISYMNSSSDNREAAFDSHPSFSHKPSLCLPSSSLLHNCPVTKGMQRNSWWTWKNMTNCLLHPSSTGRLSLDIALGRSPSCVQLKCSVNRGGGFMYLIIPSSNIYCVPTMCLVHGLGSGAAMVNKTDIKPVLIEPQF